MAEAFVEVSSLAPAADQANAQEILTSLPADALTLEEAMRTTSLMSPNKVASNLKALVNNLQSLQKHMKPQILKPRSTAEPASTDAFCPDLKQVRSLLFIINTVTDVCELRRLRRLSGCKPAQPGCT